MRRLAQTRFPMQRDTRIREVGFGSGVLLRILETWGYRRLEGVDRSAFQVQYRVSDSVQLGEGLVCLQGKDAGSLDVAVDHRASEKIGIARINDARRAGAGAERKLECTYGKRRSHFR